MVGSRRREIRGFLRGETGGREGVSRRQRRIKGRNIEHRLPITIPTNKGSGES